MNKGICQPTYPSDIWHSPRFKCTCAPGYRGNRCQEPIKSSRGYFRENPLPTSGNYTIIDDDNQPFQVFCNFNATTSWTLIQSYQLEEKAEFRKPFFTNDPKNAENPNWLSYRLSKVRMQSIQRDSSRWRMTCRYDTDGLNYTDYVEGLKVKFDILKQVNRSACIKVEFINVRGYSCTDCTAKLKQKKTRPFHHDSYYSSKDCEFKPDASQQCGNKRGEDNFGYYSCVNTAHRCSMNKTSTTQTWLGHSIENEQ